MNRNYSIKRTVWGDYINTIVAGYSVGVHRDTNGALSINIDLPAHTYHNGALHTLYTIPGIIERTHIYATVHYDTFGYVRALNTKYYQTGLHMNYAPVRTHRKPSIAFIVNELVHYVVDDVIAYRQTPQYITDVYRSELQCKRCNDTRYHCTCTDCFDCLTGETCAYCGSCIDCCVGYHYVTSW
jgi:hypothetical protein